MKYILLGLFITIVLFSCRKESGPYSLSGTIFMDCEEQQPLQYVIVDLYASGIKNTEFLASDTIGSDGKFNFIYDKARSIQGFNQLYINSGPLGYRVKNLDSRDINTTKNLGSIYFKEKGTLRVNYITSDPRTAKDTLFVGIEGSKSPPDTIIGPFNNNFSKEYMIYKSMIPGDDLHGYSTTGIISWYFKKSEGLVGDENFTVHGCGIIDEFTLEF